MPELPAKQEHIGRLVRFWDEEWRIVGINDRGDYVVERFDHQPDGCPIKRTSFCQLGLSEDHRHYAELIDTV